MTLLKLFYDSLFHYAETLRAFYLNIKGRLGYFLLLVVICFIPILLPMNQALSLWEDNRASIIKSIPDFTVENNTLKANDTKPFINKTDMMVYAYDPNDQISDSELTDTTPIGFYFKTGKTAFTISILGQTEHFSYDGRNANAQTQKDYINALTAIPHALIYLSTLLTIGITLFITALLLVVVISFMPLSVSMNLNFGRKLNLCLMAMTLPVVVLAILSIFMPSLLLSSMPLIVLIAGFRLVYLSRHIKVIPLDPAKWQEAWQQFTPEEIDRIQKGEMSDEELQQILKNAQQKQDKDDDQNHSNDPS
ncbi:MAG: DUF1189 family protein [Aerococcus sp.]|nr:DUF1189 family protein [Aerococcus sp.]